MPRAGADYRVEVSGANRLKLPASVLSYRLTWYTGLRDAA